MRFCPGFNATLDGKSGLTVSRAGVGESFTDNRCEINREFDAGDAFAG